MASPSTLLSRTSDRTFYIWNALLSACALAFIAYLLIIRRGGAGGVDLRFLPAVNATFNATAACLLVAGWIAIRKKVVRVASSKPGRAVRRCHGFCRADLSAARKRAASPPVTTR